MSTSGQYPMLSAMLKSMFTCLKSKTNILAKSGSQTILNVLNKEDTREGLCRKRTERVLCIRHVVFWTVGRNMVAQ